MKLDSKNDPKLFDVAEDGALFAMGVKQLSLAQLKQRADSITSAVMQRQREEFALQALALPPSERNKYLVAAAKSNSVSQEAFQEEAETVKCLLDTLAMATGLKTERLQRLFESDPENMISAYLYALGVDTDTQKEAGPVKAADPFPKTTDD